MIPSDVASRLRPALLEQQPAPQPVAGGNKLSDTLSDLVPGQRLLAQIQALLPNGTYRAVVAQRDVTLALPFAAKSGDSIELEVVESSGKMTLAVVPKSTGGAGSAGAGNEAVATTFSRTGQLIADLFGDARTGSGGSNAALPLNGGQPLTSAAPTSAADIAPQLKQAITQSGMFYESHQRGWVEGRVDKADLLLEPQGRLSRAASADASGAGAKPTGASELGAAASSPAGATASPSPASAAATGAAAETLPLVRQQLDSLATQQFNWQGQIWPGQEMRWQIAEEPAREGGRSGGGDDEAPEWRSRMRLALPQLGEIDARIALRGDGIRLDLAAGEETTQTVLRDALAGLRQQLDAAGLSLASFAVAGIARDDVAADAGPADGG